MNTKQKGNNFERNVSRMISDWWTGGKRTDAVWRTASSGGLATSTNKYVSQVGDFQATDACASSLFRYFIIEAKRGYSRFSFMDLVDTEDRSLPKNEVYSILTTLSRRCAEHNKFGMLIWQRDRRKTTVCVQDSFFRRVGMVPGFAFTKGALMTVRVDSTLWIVTDWDTFASGLTGSSLASKLALLDALTAETQKNLP